MQNTFTIDVSPDGTMRMIYDDALVDLLGQGHVTIRRASFVEPHPSGGWTADMAPICSHLNIPNKILGPFPSRTMALDEEYRWLSDHLFA